MSRRIRVIAKRNQPVPVNLLAKLLVAQARAENRRRRLAELTRRQSEPGDAA
ncbi:MAG: hypothetical protein LC808_32645 [Actinobacteria bacterium]|nr:hypothetical protein [Actinomycetota bacterium]